MTTERKAKQLKKRYERGVLNVARKIFNAGLRRDVLIEEGKTVIVTEKDGVKTYALPPSPIEPPTPPRLSWLGGKTYKQQGDSRRGRSGFGLEQAEAWPENASRMLAKEIDKALLPPVPVVKQVFDSITDPARLLAAPVVGEYADHAHNTLVFEDHAWGSTGTGRRAKSARASFSVSWMQNTP